MKATTEKRSLTRSASSSWSATNMSHAERLIPVIELRQHY